MAKKASAEKVNKTAEVKKLLAKNPDASPKAVSAELNKRGIKMTPAYVSTIKTNLRKQPGRKSLNGRKSTAKGGADMVSASSLKELKKLVDDIGGIPETREMLNTLDELM